jgi:hypothetical protein
VARSTTMNHAKIMFEIYLDTSYTNKHEAIYFTELGEAQKDPAITRAVNGLHVYDGFITEWRSDEAKVLVQAICAELDDGASFTSSQITARLGDFVPADDR